MLHFVVEVSIYCWSHCVGLWRMKLISCCCLQDVVVIVLFWLLMLSVFVCCCCISDCWCCLFVVDRVVWSTSQSLRVPLMTQKWRRPATDTALSWCTLMSGCFITEWGAEVYRPLPSLCSLKTAADVQCTLFTFNWKNYWGSVSRWRIVRCWIRFDCVHVHSMKSK